MHISAEVFQMMIEHKNYFVRLSKKTTHPAWIKVDEMDRIDDDKMDKNIAFNIIDRTINVIDGIIKEDDPPQRGCSQLY